MTIEEIKSFLESNKDNDDVKSFLTELKQVNQDTVKAYLDTDDGKKLVQPILDKTVTKALDTFKEKTLPGLVDSKVKELNPEITPEQKQLKEMQSELDRMKKEANKEKLLNKALTIATEKGLPTSIIDKFLGEDEETTVNNITSLETIFNEHITKSIDSKLPALGRTIKTDKKTNLSNDDILKMSPEEFAKHAPDISLT